MDETQDGALEAKCHIRHVPNEVLRLILNNLDSPSTMAERIYHDPSTITDHDDPFAKHPRHSGPLKSASLVCRLWRITSLPWLFRYCVWEFSCLARPMNQDELPQLELLWFLHQSKLNGFVTSLTIIIPWPKDFILYSHTRQNGGVFLGRRLPALQEPGVLHPPRVSDCNWLWYYIFRLLDLDTITLISSPGILAALLAVRRAIPDASCFSVRHQIISLSRKPECQTNSIRPALRNNLPFTLKVESPHDSLNHNCELFSIRNWNSLLLNEGWLRYAHLHHPTPLPEEHSSLMYQLSLVWPSSLDTLSYIAIHPCHVALLRKLCGPIQRYKKLFLKLMPSELSPPVLNASGIDTFYNAVMVRTRDIYNEITNTLFTQSNLSTEFLLDVLETGDVENLVEWGLEDTGFARHPGRWKTEGLCRIVRVVDESSVV